jgi:hypothetical protein
MMVVRFMKEEAMRNEHDKDKAIDKESTVTALVEICLSSRRIKCKRICSANEQEEAEAKKIFDEIFNSVNHPCQLCLIQNIKIARS